MQKGTDSSTLGLGKAPHHFGVTVSIEPVMHVLPREDGRAHTSSPSSPVLRWGRSHWRAGLWEPQFPCRSLAQHASGRGSSTAWSPSGEGSDTETRPPITGLHLLNTPAELDHGLLLLPRLDGARPQSPDLLDGVAATHLPCLRQVAGQHGARPAVSQHAVHCHSLAASAAPSAGTGTDGRGCSPTTRPSTTPRCYRLCLPWHYPLGVTRPRVPPPPPRDVPPCGAPPQALPARSDAPPAIPPHGRWPPPPAAGSSGSARASGG